MALLSPEYDFLCASAGVRSAQTEWPEVWSDIARVRFLGPYDAGRATHASDLVFSSDARMRAFEALCASRAARCGRIAPADVSERVARRMLSACGAFAFWLGSGAERGPTEDPAVKLFRHVYLSLHVLLAPGGGDLLRGDRVCEEHLGGTRPSRCRAIPVCADRPRASLPNVAGVRVLVSPKYATAWCAGHVPASEVAFVPWSNDRVECVCSFVAPESAQRLAGGLRIPPPSPQESSWSRSWSAH